MKLNKYIPIILLFFFLDKGRGQQWPINQTDDANYWDRISCTFGEIHPTNGAHFHTGIDIDINALNCPARNVQTGIVLEVTPDCITIMHEFPAGSGQYQRRTRYCHLQPNKNVAIDDNVSTGEQIALIDPSPTDPTLGDHLHIGLRQQDGGDWYRLNPLSNDLGWILPNPTDGFDPQINDVYIEPLGTQANNVNSGYSIVTNNGSITNYINNNTQYGKVHFQDKPQGPNETEYEANNCKLLVWGNIGFIVNTRDEAINSTLAAGNGATVKRILYRIVDYHRNTLKYDIDFTRIKQENPNEVSMEEQVFHTAFNANNDQRYGNNDFIELRSLDDTYVYPNQEINGIQSNGIWFTKAHNSTNEVFRNTPTETADINGETLYSDGNHTLRFEASDASGRNVQQVLNVVVDNFRPYIKKLEIRNPVAVNNYYQWNLNGDNLEYEEGGLGFPLNNFSRTDITVYTSEPMENVNLQSDDVTIILGCYNLSRTQWNFYINEGEIGVEELTLQITGTDLAGNNLLDMHGYITDPLASNSISVDQMPVRGDNGFSNPLGLGDNETITVSACGYLKSTNEQCDPPQSGEDDVPIANFNYTIDDNQKNLVNFINSSVNGDYYRWDFGDGEISYEENPAPHEYPNLSDAEIYEVILEVTNSNYETVSLTKTVIIPGYNSPTEDISLTGNWIETTNTNEISFNFSFIADNQNAGHDIYLDFGDGTIFQEWKRVSGSYSKIVEHTYPDISNDMDYYPSITVKRLDNDLVSTYHFDRVTISASEIESLDIRIDIESETGVAVRSQNFNLRAESLNGFGKHTFNWTIFKQEGDLLGEGASDSYVKYGHGVSISDPISFDEDGEYLVRLNVWDENGVSGFKEYVVGVGTNTGCATVELLDVGCSSQYTYSKGSRINFSAEVTAASCYNVDDVAKYEWFLIDENGNQDLVSEACNMDGLPEKSTCIPFDEIGEFELRAVVYPKKYDKGNWYIDNTNASSVSRTIKIIDDDDEIVINSNLDLQNNSQPKGRYVIFCQAPGSSVVINAGDNITATGKRSVTLQPGFWAKNGSNFNAKIAPPTNCSCQPISYGSCDNIPIYDIGNINIHVESVPGKNRCYGGEIEIWYTLDEGTGGGNYDGFIGIFEHDEYPDGSSFRHWMDIEPGEKVTHGYTGLSSRRWYIYVSVANNYDWKKIWVGGCFTEYSSPDSSNSSTSISINNIGHDFEIYPNPTSGEFTLEFKGDFADIERVEVYNSSGQKVLENLVNTYINKFDLSGYAKGIYFLRIIGNKGQHSEKIIYK